MRKKQVTVFILSLIALFLFMEGVGFYVGTRETRSEYSGDDGNKEKKNLGIQQSRNRALKNRLGASVPGDVYIVVDSARNRLLLKRGLHTLREAVISCGSGNILREPQGKRRWIFDTPRGIFRVRSKHVSPVWTKPDWAFFEEGENVPPTLQARQEEGVMGDYSLGFGNGYFIHGTLYTRLLGRNVTHGCIRAGDKDLRAVYSAASIGTRIFIF